MLRVRFEVKPEFAWIGAFWTWSEIAFGNRRSGMTFSPDIVVGHQLDVWICPLPCLPIHVTYVPPVPASASYFRWDVGRGDACFAMRAAHGVWEKVE